MMVYDYSIFGDPNYDPSVFGMGGLPSPGVDINEIPSYDDPNKPNISVEDWVTIRSRGIPENRMDELYDILPRKETAIVAVPPSVAREAKPITPISGSNPMEVVMGNDGKLHLKNSLPGTVVPSSAQEVIANKNSGNYPAGTSSESFADYGIPFKKQSRLIMTPYQAYELQVMNELKNAAQQLQITNPGDWVKLASMGAGGLIDFISSKTGWSKDSISSTLQKLSAAGASGLLMALTGNFPVAAMGYFAIDRGIDASTGKQIFNGVTSKGGYIDGIPLTPIGVGVPDGLPNDIFDKYRFVNYDRLTSMWFPSDEIQPLDNIGQPFRYLCLDRLDGSVYRANLIRRPRIAV